MQFEARILLLLYSPLIVKSFSILFRFRTRKRKRKRKRKRIENDFAIKGEYNNSKILASNCNFKKLVIAKFRKIQFFYKFSVGYGVSTKWGNKSPLPLTMYALLPFSPAVEIFGLTLGP